MKVQIDIITGFLGSGKTTFINGMLRSELLSKERIVILQCEAGEEELSIDAEKAGNIHAERADMERVMDTGYIKELLARYAPDRIIIEHNGMAKLEKLMFALENGKTAHSLNINTVAHVVSSSEFEIFMNNMGSILVEQISLSDLIIVNTMENEKSQKLKSISRSLTEINKAARIVTVSSPEECRLAVDHGLIYEEKVKIFSKPTDKLFLGLLLGAVAYFLFAAYRALRGYGVDMSGLGAFNTIFLSILIQAFPFILIGVLISSILQVLVSEETIVRIFPKNKIAAFGVAIVSGVVFPVCDCAIVPVVGRLVRKGVPLPAAMTFMLAAPIVNPIVIASTFYAFPGQPGIVFCRTLLGILVAVVVGMALMFFPEKNSMFLNRMDSYACKCGFCGEGYEKAQGIIGKINGIFMHTASEFFEVGKFLVIGAFISTAMLIIIPRDAFAGSQTNAVALLVMMVAAFVFSICSTSDAFIARTFTSQFPLSAVMGFLVLGPMFDIKNLLMLLGSFRKRFVMRLVLIIFGASFVLIYVLAPFLLQR